jgi:hypothetical protein
MIYVLLPSPAAISDRAWAGDSTTSSFIPSTKVPYSHQFSNKQDILNSWKASLDNKFNRLDTKVDDKELCGVFSHVRFVNRVYTINPESAEIKLQQEIRSFM